MRATILPLVIILTEAHKATVNMIAKNCDLSILRFEVFLIFTSQL